MTQHDRHTAAAANARRTAEAAIDWLRRDAILEAASDADALLHRVAEAAERGDAMRLRFAVAQVSHVIRQMLIVAEQIGQTEARA